jgi:hypothetical protein
MYVLFQPSTKTSDPPFSGLSQTLGVKPMQAISLLRSQDAQTLGAGSLALARVNDSLVTDGPAALIAPRAVVARSTALWAVAWLHSCQLVAKDRSNVSEVPTNMVSGGCDELTHSDWLAWRAQEIEEVRRSAQA